MSSVEKWAKIQEMTQKWASQDELVVCLKLDLKTKKVKFAGPSSMKPFSKDVDVINKFLKYAECTHRDSKAIDVPVAPVGIPNLAIEDINLPNLRKIVPNIVAADVYKRKRVLKGFWGMNCFKPVWYPHDVDFKSPNVNDDKGKRMPRADLEKVLSAYKNYVISSGRTLPLPSTATGTDSGSSEKDMNEHQVTESQEENMDIDDHSVPMDIDNSIPGQSSVQKEENIHKIVSTDAQSAPLPLTSKSPVETQLDALNAVDSWETFSAICQTIDNEITKLPMTPMTFNDLHGVQTHKRYMKISTIPSGYWPVQVKGNGNCFFNSISVLLFGNEDHSSDLRLAALLHGAGHLDHYVEIYCHELTNEDSATQFMCTVSTDHTFNTRPTQTPSKRDIVLHTLQSDVMETAKLNTDSGLLQMLFMAGSLGRPIQQYSEESRFGYDICLQTCPCQEGDHQSPLNVLWVRFKPISTQMNHLVPLLKVRDVRRPNITKPVLPLVDMDFCTARFDGLCTASEQEEESDKWLGCSKCYTWVHSCCIGINPGELMDITYHCCTPIEEMENHKIFEWGPVSDDGERVVVGLTYILSARPRYGLTNGIIDFCLSYCKQRNIRDDNTQALLQTCVVDAVKRHQSVNEVTSSLRNACKMENWPNKLLLSFHCSNWHWVAIEMDLTEQKVYVIDSLETKKSMDEVVPVVKLLLKAIGKTGNVEFNYKQGPIQTNSVDCGCYMLYNLLQIALKKLPQVDEPKIGMKMRKFIVALAYSKGNTNISFPF